MNFHIPFTISSLERQKKKKQLFKSLVKHKKKSKLQFYLDNTDAGINREEYLNVCLRTFVISFISIYLVSTTIMLLLSVRLAFLFGFLLSIAFSGFIFFSQTIYPKIYASRKEKNIEKNLIPALEDIHVQLTSGIPIFGILVNIASSNYDYLSREFKKIVRKINAGIPQVQVLEDLGKASSSTFFRRTLWQLSNGMKAGSDLTIVVQDSIKNLNEEQLIQIQRYGNKLNPLVMFYMLISVILPALSITFITIIISMINLPKTTAMLIYAGIFVTVVFIQIMFLGVIKSARPTLL